MKVIKGILIVIGLIVVIRIVASIGIGVYYGVQMAKEAIGIEQEQSGFVIDEDGNVVYYGDEENI